MFRGKRRNTSVIAKDRLRLLVDAERIDCSPGILLMMKKDMIKAVNKYILVDEDKVSLTFRAVPPTLSATIAVKKTPHSR
ncbi:MAG TPA: cell division topological specificity factor MinE [Candidatus Ruminococcus avistercoris]|nr:cell division topological specificity factor MinE [Candidatus Ruminococcus avistercoris]